MSYLNALSSNEDRRCFQMARSRLRIALESSDLDAGVRKHLQTASELLRQIEDRRQERRELILTCLAAVFLVPVVYVTICLLFCL